MVAFGIAVFLSCAFPLPMQRLPLRAARTVRRAVLPFCTAPINTYAGLDAPYASTLLLRRVSTAPSTQASISAVVKEIADTAQSMQTPRLWRCFCRKSRSPQLRQYLSSVAIVNVRSRAPTAPSIVRPRPRPKEARVVEREEAVTETPPAAPTLPRRRELDFDEGSGNLWDVLLHNDDIHTFDYTIQALAKCVPITRKKAHTIVGSVIPYDVYVCT